MLDGGGEVLRAESRRGREKSDVDAGIDLITLISIAAVFVLSEVFHEGARMKEEQDLTV